MGKYAHVNEATDRAVWACGVLGMEFWSLAPGSSTAWATMDGEYWLVTFRTMPKTSYRPKPPTHVTAHAQYCKGEGTYCGSGSPCVKTALNQTIPARRLAEEI